MDKAVILVERGGSIQGRLENLQMELGGFGFISQFKDYLISASIIP